MGNKTSIVAPQEHFKVGLQSCPVKGFNVEEIDQYGGLLNNKR